MFCCCMVSKKRGGDKKKDDKSVDDYVKELMIRRLSVLYKKRSKIQNEIDHIEIVINSKNEVNEWM